MEYDLICPENENAMNSTPCLIAAVYFDDDELKRFEVPEDAFELNEEFIDYNEYDKVFELWNSPEYLSHFYELNRTYFEQDYWGQITEEEFASSVMSSVRSIKKRFAKKIQSNDFGSLVEPLAPEEVIRRDFDSIKVKIKQGTIGGRYPFRFYAIEIEENKCYLITGATIKVHKDMGKAPNTRVEMKKLEFVMNVMKLADVSTKESFIDFLRK